MNYPYTSQPFDAFVAAQTSAGLVLGATVLGRRIRPWPAVPFFLATVLPTEGEFLRGLGVTLKPEHAKTVLKLAAAMATVGVLFTRQRWLVALGILGQAALWPITNYIQDCDSDLAAAHLAWIGLPVGAYRPRAPARAPGLEPASAPAPALDLLRGFSIDDAVIGAVATVVPRPGPGHGGMSTVFEAVHRDQ